MADWKSQVWVTSVMNEESVEAALVLTESLRRSMTTRQIVAITSQNVSLKQRLTLRETFDVVLLLDEMSVGGSMDCSAIGETVAKAYMFSLTQFNKCIYISPNSMLLENADNLFDSKLDFECRVNEATGGMDLSVFLVRPDYEMWKRIFNSMTDEGNGISDSQLGTWITNEGSALKTGLLPENMVADFCLDSYKLNCSPTKTHTPIIVFKGNEDGTSTLYERIKSSQIKEVELPESDVKFLNLIPKLMTLLQEKKYEELRVVLSEMVALSLEAEERSNKNATSGEGSSSEEDADMADSGAGVSATNEEEMLLKDQNTTSP